MSSIMEVAFCSCQTANTEQGTAARPGEATALPSMQESERRLVSIMSTVPDDLVVSRKSDINLSCQQMQICISLPILTLCRAAYILGPSCSAYECYPCTPCTKGNCVSAVSGIHAQLCQHSRRGLERCLHSRRLKSAVAEAKVHNCCDTVESTFASLASMSDR